MKIYTYVEKNTNHSRFHVFKYILYECKPIHEEILIQWTLKFVFRLIQSSNVSLLELIAAPAW